MLAIDHVGIAVADLDAAIDFHRTMFGMEVAHRESNEDQGVEEAMLAVGDSGSFIQLLAPLRPASPIGRFLEHSRVYWFRNDGKPEVFLGSADLMERNLDRRVETIFPIYDPVLARRIVDEALELGLADNVKSRELGADGVYRSVPADSPLVDSQSILLQRQT